MRLKGFSVDDHLFCDWVYGHDFVGVWGFKKYIHFLFICCKALPCITTAYIHVCVHGTCLCVKIIFLHSNELFHHFVHGYLKWMVYLHYFVNFSFLLYLSLHYEIIYYYYYFIHFISICIICLLLLYQIIKKLMA